MASSFFASITLKCKLYRSPDNLCKPINVNCIQHNACGNPVEAYKPTQTPLLLGAPYREALVVIYRHYCYPAEEKGCSHSIAIGDKTTRRPWVTDSIKEPPLVYKWCGNLCKLTNICKVRKNPINHNKIVCQYCHNMMSHHKQVSNMLI